ncbi:hypothetical protein KCU61_g6526, partial [Aureobasidium melanogenum]
MRKRVGNIRFWLEDRENRRIKGERVEASAFTTSAHHKNSAPVRATTTLRPKRNTTTPRRILSHVEIIVPARKHQEPLNQFVKHQSSPATAEAHSLAPSPIMANKRKNTDAAYAARPPRKKTHPSTQAKSSAPPEEPPLATRRPTRATKQPNYSDYTAYLDIGDSDEELEQKPVENSSAEEGSYTNSEDEQSASSTMSSHQSLSSGEPASESESIDEPMRKRAKANDGRPRKPAKSTPDSVPEPTESTESMEVCDSSEPQIKSKSKKTKVNMRNLNRGMKKDVNRTLPPLFEISAIFNDLVGKGLRTLQAQTIASDDAQQYSLEDVCKHVGSRPLRVATMCSGTESPLLALDMISDCIRKRGDGLELNYEHVFSAEIVPFKQAYIERNFRPPIIFRDITEITKGTNGVATNAYGAEAQIPGDVDMLIAGTACVDFSNLNSKKKTLQERGESGDTFAAVLAYAEKYRPTMLVLENVFGAPWDEMLAEYEGHRYVSAGVLVDSKNYYLPQTRQRGYMVCIDKDKLEACNIEPAVFKDDFEQRMEDFKRPVSSPLSSFILPNDDPLVIRASQSMARQSLLDSSLREVDWAKCEIRHINYRREKALGIARPLTNWQESGTLVLPENCNRLWFGKQVERVWDFVDMSQLRKANMVPGRKNHKTKIISEPTPGYDAQYKTRIWDVSQNIDRFTDSAPFGIAPCLTPSGNFYITDRGGPLTFTESLMLQGLPLDRISFTTETERNIQDLAGNAMSTTVVGSAIASVLIAGFKTLPPASDYQAVKKSLASRSVLTPIEEPDVQHALQATVGDIDLHELQADALKSVAMCVCEGQIGLSEKDIQICTECGHTSCLSCGVKPLHEYAEPLQPERRWPEHFIQKWRPLIPMVLVFSSSKKLIAHIKQSIKLTEPVKRRPAIQLKKLKERYISAAEKALEHAFTFKAFRRSSSWSIIYDSPFARLELVLGAQPCAWKLYANPGDDISSDDEIRKFFEEPVGIAQVTEGAFFGSEWRWRLFEGAAKSKSKLDITGQGEQVPSWAARLGLPKRAGDRVWSELRIVNSDDKELLEDVEGTYKLLRDCGTACESLYKRTVPTGGPSMFLFLDPERIGKPTDDRFVFARDHSRLQYDQVREVTARVNAAWRPETQTERSSCVDVSLNGHWVVDASCLLGATNANPILSLKHPSSLEKACSVTETLVSLTFDLPSSILHQRYQGHHRIDPDDKIFFAAFGWALEPLRRNLGVEGAQQSLADQNCEPCAPSAPEVCWRTVLTKQNGIEFLPYENTKSARDYENAIKSRPQPFIIECDLQGNSGTLHIGLNTTTLCHRTAAKLRTLTGSVKSVSWNLNTTWAGETSVKFSPFTLRNNSDNVQCVADKKILSGIELFDIQQRSLTWMKQQEHDVGRSFTVKETEEVLLPHLGWRLESQASTELHVKGGILADHAGFGKTVTSLALIHSEFVKKGIQGILKEMQNVGVNEGVSNKEESLQIKIAATLVICPGNLVKQWASEVDKYLGYGKKCLAVQNIAHWKKLRVKDFEDAKIVIVSKTLLTHDVYLDQLAVFSAMPKYAGKNTRYLKSHVRDAAFRVSKHLSIRNSQGSVKLKDYLEKLYKETLQDPKYSEYAEQSKRLKGKSYAENKNNSSNISSPVAKVSDESRNYKDIDNCVFLEMFHFNRLVVDEFSYTEADELVKYCNINASKRWALSATPRLNDTYDVSRMARFLGLDLPIGASAPGLLSSSNMTALHKDLTGLELFETFREMPSRTTQKSIHALAQKFLDTFLRQNLLRHDQRPYYDEIIPTTLYADNRLVYTDLSQRFNSQDMRIRKGRNRIAELSVVPKVTTAEEALLSVAAIYDPSKQLPTETPRKNVSSGLETLVERCENDYNAAQHSLREQIKSCLGAAGKLNLFTEWIDNVVTTNAFGDQGVADEIAAMSRGLAAELAAKTPEPKPKGKRKQPKAASQDVVETISDHVGNADDEGDSEEGDPYMTAEQQEDIEKDTRAGKLKDAISDVVSDAKAYAASTRTLRFLKNAFKHEKCKQDLSISLRCNGEGCNNTVEDSSDLRVSANCGHILCSDCIETSNNLLGICPADGCEKDVKSYHLLPLGKLGKSIASKYGSKADALKELLKKIVAQGQQAIVFVQFAHQIEEMRNVLNSANISHYYSKGDKTTDAIEAFKIVEGPKRRTALILNSNDESAAGANLMNANHVIFFSPLLKRTQYEYEAQMAQAIGRVRRPNQANDVHVYRFVSLDTIDVDILEHREHRATVLPEYQDPNLKKRTPGTDFEGKLKPKLVKPQKTQLIRDFNGEYKLVPRQLLLAAGGEGVVEGNNRILGYEKFNSLIKFSSGFLQDD